MAAPGCGLHVALPDAPGVWSSSSHVGVVWCNQLAAALAAALLRGAEELPGRLEQLGQQVTEQQQQVELGQQVLSEPWQQEQRLQAAAAAYWMALLRSALAIDLHAVLGYEAATEGGGGSGSSSGGGDATSGGGLETSTTSITGASQGHV